MEEDGERGHASLGTDRTTEPLVSLCGESAVDILRSVLASCTGAPASSCSMTQDTGNTSPSPGAALLSTRGPEQRIEALGMLIDLVAAHMGLSGLRCGLGQSGELTDKAAPRVAADALLLYLTAEKPSLLAALRRRRCQRPRMLPPEALVAHAGSRVSDGACACSEEDQAWIILTRYAASVVLANRHLGGVARVGLSDGRIPASRVLQTRTALSLARAAYSSYQPLRTALGGKASSQPPVSVVDASTYWCSTGCVCVDQALGGGGFRSGWVTEVYGEAGSGKTQLMLQCLLQQAATDICSAAVAVLMSSNEGFTSLDVTTAAASAWSTNNSVAACKDVFDRDVVDAARCAVVYLVSEEVPVSRLGPLAAAAVGRAVRAVRLHPLLTQLPPCALKTVGDFVESTCTVTAVLSRLQIRHVASLAEVLQLLEPPFHAQTVSNVRITVPTTSVPNRAQQPPHTRLADAVDVFSGSLRRAVVVLDSIAAAVVAGQCDLRGVPQDDATVAAVGLRLRHVAMTYNWCILVTNQVRAVPKAARQRQSVIVPIKRARSPMSSSTAPSSSGTRAVVPALGLSWASIPQCRVFLCKSLTHGVRQLVLRHAPFLPPAQVSYLITEHGIEDA